MFRPLGGRSGTWTHTTQTVNAPAGGPYTTTNNFAWGIGEANSPTESATATDAAGNTSNRTEQPRAKEKSKPPRAPHQSKTNANSTGRQGNLPTNPAGRGPR